MSRRLLPGLLAVAAGAAAGYFFLPGLAERPDWQTSTVDRLSLSPETSFRVIDSQSLENLACIEPSGQELSAEPGTARLVPASWSPGEARVGRTVAANFMPPAQNRNSPADGPAGGDLRPLRIVQDAYSTFAGIAVNPETDEVVMTDENRFSLLVYDRRINVKGVAEPRRRISGDNTQIEFICGVTIDPVTGDIYTVNNDTMDNMLVFSRDQDGNIKPARELKVDHGAWGVSLDRGQDEVAITIQHLNKITIYRRAAEGEEPPLRTIWGLKTGLADPHGVFIDGKNNEIFVTNQGSYRGRVTGRGADVATRRGVDEAVGSVQFRPVGLSTGRFFPPSIRVFQRLANGDVEPIRVIGGPKTRLNLPLGIYVDT
ncbi:MAG: hypothetical protein HY315_02305, partial [Acidobacteria bacterium]|nr:hypothetical protein [Acidobacteriota bacterium]